LQAPNLPMPLMKRITSERNAELTAAARSGGTGDSVEKNPCFSNSDGCGVSRSSLCRTSLVAGAGFEPAIPRLRDYEPNELAKNREGSRPVAVQKPPPHFWAFRRRARRLAVE